MPTIIDRIRALLKPSRTAEPTTSTDVQSHRVTDLIERFQAERGRTEIVKKCREMYANDPRAKKMLRTLARDVVKNGFVVKTDDAQALAVADELKRRLNLDQRLDDYARLTARDGDSFLEVSINASLEIVKVTRKPTLEMHRASDAFDGFPDPERAYWWSDLPFVGEPPRNAVWFAQWQIIHARWEHDEGNRYGTPMMASGVSHYKKVVEGELDIAVRRKTRAGMKYVHKFPADVAATTIDAYREANKDALDNPFAAVADFFGNVDIQAVQGDATLSEIADVKHHIATWFTAGETPMELIAYGEDLNRDVLGEKKAEYAETLEQLREWATAEIVKPLLELQWLLQGIYPANLDYSIEWRVRKEPSAADIRDVADAATKLLILGVSREVIAAVIAKFLPEVDPDELMGDAENPADAGRLDAIAGALGGGA